MRKTDEKRGMDAVITKSSGQGRRKAAMRRKGAPGVAIMIALGKPGKGPMGDEKTDDEPINGVRAAMGKKQSKAQRIAAIQEQIGALKAELALLDAEDDEMDDEGMEGDESEDEMEDEED